MKGVGMNRTTRFGLLLGGVILSISALVGCGSCSWNLDLVDYTPLPGDDWEVSTPEAEGLDPREERLVLASHDVLHARIPSSGWIHCDATQTGRQRRTGRVDRPEPRGRWPRPTSTRSELLSQGAYSYARHRCRR